MASGPGGPRRPRGRRWPPPSSRRRASRPRSLGFTPASYPACWTAFRADRATSGRPGGPQAGRRRPPRRSGRPDAAAGAAGPRAAAAPGAPSPAGRAGVPVGDAGRSGRLARPWASPVTSSRPTTSAGTVPDQLDATCAGPSAAAVARFTGAPRLLVVRDMRPRGPSWRRPSPRGSGPRGRRSPTSGWPRPTSCTSPRAASTPRAPCSPPRTTRPATTASSSAWPGPGPSAATPGWPRSRPLTNAAAGRPTPAARPAGPARPPRPARGVRRARPVLRRPGGRCGRSRWWPTRPTGWAGWWCPLVMKGLPFDVEILFAELDGTFPNHPADPIQPENLVDLKRGGARPRGPTSAWPSTATPTGSSWSTSGPSRCRARSPPPWWRRPCSTSTRGPPSSTT